MGYTKESLKLHQQWREKLSVVPKIPIKAKLDLSMTYTSGTVEAYMEIHRNIERSYRLTGRWNTVAVVMDRTAVSGLGDTGLKATIPVMEGGCVLFKAFGDVDATPIYIRPKDVDEIVHTVSLLAGSFGGVNLGDATTPRYFEIERRLKECCDIPALHDDRHGTTIVVIAVLSNALKIVEKEVEDIKIAINGIGSAGIAIARLLLPMRAKQLILCNRSGTLHEEADGLDEEQVEISTVMNLEKRQRSFSDAIVRADVLIGASAPGAVNQEMIRSVTPKAIVSSTANPTLEIMPDLALEAGVVIVGAGRGDFPNQVNDVLVFPGIFRGVLDMRARVVNDEMKMVAACALIGLISDDGLRPEYILLESSDPRIREAIAKAVANTAMISGVTRK